MGTGEVSDLPKCVGCEDLVGTGKPGWPTSGAEIEPYGYLCMPCINALRTHRDEEAARRKEARMKRESVYKPKKRKLKQ